MGRMMNALVSFLAEEELPYYHTESESHLFIPVATVNGPLKCLVEAREDEQQILFVAIIQRVIPSEKLLAVAEFIARVNATLAIGSFDLDFQAGLVAYRTSIEVAETPLTPALIRPLPTYAIAMADKYTPGITEIVYADALPADALNSIERRSQEDVTDLVGDLLD